MSVPSYLGESAIVPDVAVVWEDVTNKSQLAFLDILLDIIHAFSGAHLQQRHAHKIKRKQMFTM